MGRRGMVPTVKGLALLLLVLTVSVLPSRCGGVKDPTGRQDMTSTATNQVANNRTLANTTVAAAGPLLNASMDLSDRDLRGRSLPQYMPQKAFQCSFCAMCKRGEVTEKASKKCKSACHLCPDVVAVGAESVVNIEIDGVLATQYIRLPVASAEGKGRALQQDNSVTGVGVEVVHTATSWFEGPVAFPGGEVPPVSSIILPGFLTVDGLITGNSGLVITSGGATVTGDSSIDGSFLVTGASDLQSTLHVVGATQLDSTLTVDQATVLHSTLTVDQATSLHSTLSVLGNVAVNNNKFTVAASSGNTVISGTLSTAGATTLGSTLDVADDVRVNSNRFVVTSSTGAVSAAAGEFVVAADGSLAINTNMFTVDGADGDTKITGELDVAKDVRVNSNRFAVTSSTGAVSAAAGEFLIAADGSVSVNEKFLVTAATGAVSAAAGEFVVSEDGSLAVNTNIFTIDGVDGDTTIAGELDVAKDVRVNSNKYVVTSSTGAVSAAAGEFTVAADGSLNVNQGAFTVTAANGNTAIEGLLGVNDDLRVGAAGAQMFTVEASNGNTVISGSLQVADKVTVDVNGNTLIDGTLGVQENMRIGAAGADRFTVAASTGNTAISGVLGVTGATTLGSSLTVAGNVAVNSNAAISGTLTTTGATQLSSTLGVTGLSSLNGINNNNGGITNTGAINGVTRLSVVNITASGTVSAASIIATTGPNSLTGGLTVVNGGASIDAGGLSVSGPTTIGGELAVSEATTLSSSLAVGGDTSIAGNLGVTGSFAINSDKFFVYPDTGNTGIAGTLGVSGATYLSSTLNLGGAATLGSSLSISGSTNLGSTLNVAGATSLGSSLSVASDVVVNSNKFTVSASSGNTGVAGTLGVGGAVNLGSTLGVSGTTYLGGAATLGSSLNVAGAIGGASTIDASGAVTAPRFVATNRQNQASTLFGGVAIPAGTADNPSSSYMYLGTDAGGTSFVGATGPYVINSNGLYINTATFAGAINSNSNIQASGSVTGSTVSASGNVNAGGKLMEGGNPLLPRGMIMMWSGGYASIPAGWALCDGGNGTPDLRDRFIVGAGWSYSPGNTGGAATVTLTESQMPSHAHLQRDHTHDIGFPNFYLLPIENDSPDTSAYVHGGWYDRTTYGPTYQDGNPYTHNTGGNQAHENRPPYFALAYVMKM